MNDDESIDLRNGMLDRMKAGGVVGMLSVRLSRGPEIALLARAAGFDALYVDLEHATMSADDASRICMACLGAGVTPLVRVPSPDAADVPRLLDGGAMGIIAPHVRTADDARRLVSRCRFPPLGTRSSVAWLPQLGYRTLAPVRAAEIVNRATAVVAMVEDAESLRNVDAIAAVEGVDALFVGANDLAADLGIAGQDDHPAIDAAFAAVIDACRRHGKAAGVGGLARRDDLLRRHVGLGARFVSMGTDLSFLLDGARRQARVVQGLLPDRV